METSQNLNSSVENESSSQPNTQTKLVNAPINSENDALNIMVQFLNLAQRRGAFSIDESAKIYNCFQKFK
jgi:hypothetical protein